MVTREDLESFLIRMDVDYEEVDDGMYLLRSRNGGPPIVAHHSPPLLLLRMKVMDLEKDEASNAGLYRALLELNATDVVHGAYGIEEGELILSDTLELETLDFHELQASIDSIQMALSGHMARIRDLSGIDDVAVAGTGAPVGTPGGGEVYGIGGSSGADGTGGTTTTSGGEA